MRSASITSVIIDALNSMNDTHRDARPFIRMSTQFDILMGIRDQQGR